MAQKTTKTDQKETRHTWNGRPAPQTFRFTDWAMI